MRSATAAELIERGFESRPCVAPRYGPRESYAERGSCQRVNSAGNQQRRRRERNDGGVLVCSTFQVGVSVRSPGPPADAASGTTGFSSPGSRCPPPLACPNHVGGGAHEVSGGGSGTRVRRTERGDPGLSRAGRRDTDGPIASCDSAFSSRSTQCQ